MSRYHQGCSVAYHDHLIGDPVAWSREVRGEEHAAVLGTDRYVVRGVCQHCGRSLIRGTVAMSEAVLDRAPTARTVTVAGLPVPPVPGPRS